MTYNKKKNSLIKLDSLPFEKVINSISISNDKDDKNIYYLYICLKHKKVVKFCKINIKNKKIKKSKEKIKEEKKGSFDKCIYIENNQFATYDWVEESIKIWKKNKDTKLYSNIKEINLSSYIDNLFFVNNECLVSGCESV
jgi:hypothetical protein